MSNEDKKEMRKKEKQYIPWQDKAANCIAKRIISIQLFISCRLQKLEQRLTVKQKKTGLFIFCFISSIYLLYLLGNALFIKQSSHYPHLLPQKGRALSPPDSAHLSDSTKLFNHYKNQSQ